jgi:hypothetical protein
VGIRKRSVTEEDIEKARVAAEFEPDEHVTLSNAPWISSVHFRRLVPDPKNGVRTVFSLAEARVLPFAQALAERLGCTVLQKVEVGYNTGVFEERQIA